MRWFQLICLLAALSLTVGCSTSTKEIEADTTDTTDTGPSPEEMMGQMPEEARKMYKDLEEGKTPTDPGAAPGGGN